MNQTLCFHLEKQKGRRKHGSEKPLHFPEVQVQCHQTAIHRNVSPNYASQFRSPPESSQWRPVPHWWGTGGGPGLGADLGNQRVLNKCRSDSPVGSKENITTADPVVSFLPSAFTHAHAHTPKPRLCRRMQIARRYTCYGSSGNKFPKVRTSCDPPTSVSMPPPAARRRRRCATETRTAAAAFQQRRPK